MPKVLITGASGFIGRYVSSLFLEHQCIKVVRQGTECNLPNIFRIDDFNQNTNWDGAFNDVSSIIHLAGLAHNAKVSNNEYNVLNVLGTLHLAKQAAQVGVKRFVFVSSIGVNGSCTHDAPFTDSTPPNPHNHYARSKYDAEIGLKKIADESGLEVVIVRPTLVYGPNAPGNFGILTKLVKKFPFLPFGFANNKRDFIAVQNLADLLITCANHPYAAGHTFLASDGETVSIKEFTNAIAKGLNKKLIQLPVPVSIMRLLARLVGKSAMAEQLLGNLQVDSSNAQEVLGWTPPYTMERAMASLSENKK